MSATRDDIQKRRLRAIFMMEFRIVLYRCLVTIEPVWLRCLAAAMAPFACLVLLVIGDPSLASQAPDHALAGPLWMFGALALIYCLGLCLIVPFYGHAATDRRDHIRAIMPLTALQHRLAAEAGRFAVVTPAVAAAVSLLLLARWLAVTAGSGSPSLVPVRYWLLAVLGASILGIAWRYFTQSRRAQRRKPTIAEVVGMMVTFPFALLLLVRVPDSWPLLPQWAAWMTVYSASFWLGGALGRAAQSIFGGPVAGRHGVLGRLRLRLDLRWVLSPDVDFSRWAKAACRTLAALAVAAALFVTAWPLGVRAVDIGAYVIAHRAWPAKPIVSDPEELSRGARMCLAGLPLLGTLLCLALWADRGRGSGLLFGPEGAWHPSTADLLPLREGQRWSGKLRAALLFAVGCPVLGELFAALGHLIARAFGGAPPLPTAAHWAALAAPAIALSAWAQVGLLRMPVKLSGIWHDASGQIGLVIVIGVQQFIAFGVCMSLLGPDYPLLWLPIWWALTGVVLLWSCLADRPARWRIPAAGLASSRTETAVACTIVAWTLLLTLTLWTALMPLFVALSAT